MMKKIFYVLTFLVLLFFTSCKSKEEKALEEFLNSPNLQTDIIIRVEQEHMAAEIKLCNIKINNDGMALEIYSIDSTIIADTNSNILYYSTPDKNYYSIINKQGITDVLPVSTTTEETSLDIMDYISNIEYSRTSFSFDLDIENLLLDYNQNIDKETIKELELKKINCFGNFADNVVESFSIDLTSIQSTLNDLGYEEEGKLLIIFDNINYLDEVDILGSINISDYVQVTDSVMFEKILQDLQFIYDDNKNNNNQENNNNNQQNKPSYKVAWFEDNYTIRDEKTLKLDGYLYDNNYHQIHFNQCNIKYSPRLDLTNPGLTEYTISITYNGCTLEETIFYNINCSFTF